MSKDRGPWIQTFTGKKFYPLDPRPEDIDIVDIAKALSRQCRFSGHTSAPVYVATHAVNVSLLSNTGDEMWGLLHDASEAYLVDVPRPIKPLLHGYAEIEKKTMEAVCEHFHLPSTGCPPSVKKADGYVLALEAYMYMNVEPGEWSCLADFEALRKTDQLDLLRRINLAPVSHDESEQRFMDRYLSLLERPL